MPVERRNEITLYECGECGWITVGGSIHGCVRCLTKREPTPAVFVRARHDEPTVESVAAAIGEAMGVPASFCVDAARRAAMALGAFDEGAAAERDEAKSTVTTGPWTTEGDKS